MATSRRSCALREQAARPVHAAECGGGAANSVRTSSIISGSDRSPIAAVVTHSSTGRRQPTGRPRDEQRSAPGNFGERRGPRHEERAHEQDRRRSMRQGQPVERRATTDRVAEDVHVGRTAGDEVDGQPEQHGDREPARETGARAKWYPAHDHADGEQRGDRPDRPPLGRDREGHAEGDQGRDLRGRAHAVQWSGFGKDAKRWMAGARRGRWPGSIGWGAGGGGAVSCTTTGLGRAGCGGRRSPRCLRGRG